MPEEAKQGTAKAESKPEETKKPAEKPAEKVADKPTEKTVAKNCAQCNKPIKKKGGYYRNGKYYCNKRCFKVNKTKTASASVAA